VHAALGRIAQRAPQRLVRDEVRIHDAHFLLRVVDRGDEGRVHVVDAFLGGRAFHHPHDMRPGGRDRGVVRPVRHERLVAPPRPLPEECALHIRYRGSFDARLHVAPRSLVHWLVAYGRAAAGRGAIDVADVDAAYESHAAIDDGDLAVVSLVELVDAALA